MAGSINKVILVGNLGADPKVSNTQSGAKIVNLNVATSDTWKDKLSGERKDRTEWHRVVIFNPQLADIAERYLRKGSKVYLEGQLQTRKWEDSNGQERYTTEVVLQNSAAIWFCLTVAATVFRQAAMMYFPLPEAAVGIRLRPAALLPQPIWTTTFLFKIWYRFKKQPGF